MAKFGAFWWAFSRVKLKKYTSNAKFEKNLENSQFAMYRKRNYGHSVNYEADISLVADLLKSEQPVQEKG